MDLPLPCPLSAGWELVRILELPREGVDGFPMGGFSAAAYEPSLDRLWLLSDAPRGHLVPWSGLARLLANPVSTALKPGPRLLLRDSSGHGLPSGFDGEGLVLEGRNAWIVSEGRRTGTRSARLIRIDLQNGRQQQVVPLPPSWHAAPGQGLALNRGPESLTRLGRGDLLLAAERPLLQQPAVAPVPLARSLNGQPARPYGVLSLTTAEPADGLTDLLALPQQHRLLALMRGYQPPASWSAQLLVFPLPDGGSPPLQPLIGWNLLAIGLPADNWEALAAGPRLLDGRRSLLLASDNNFNPLQTNWLAVLAPRRTSTCTD